MKIKNGCAFGAQHPAGFAKRLPGHKVNGVVADNQTEIFVGKRQLSSVRPRMRCLIMFGGQ